MKKVLFSLLPLALCALVGGCTTNVTVEGSVPTPLVAKLPVRVGVYYSPDFRSFQHEEVIEQQGTYKVDLGEQNLVFFRNLMDAMFESAVEVDDSIFEREERPSARRMAEQGLDGVIVPEIEKYGFLTPFISGLNFYSASIHYRVTLYDAKGDRVGTWTLVGYGKAEGAVFGANEALGEATLLAIRDGGARIAIDIPAEPAVVAWAEKTAGAPQQRDTREGGV